MKKGFFSIHLKSFNYKSCRWSDKHKYRQIFILFFLSILNILTRREGPSDLYSQKDRNLGSTRKCYLLNRRYCLMFTSSFHWLLSRIIRFQSTNLYRCSVRIVLVLSSHITVDFAVVFLFQDSEEIIYLFYCPHIRLF